MTNSLNRRQFCLVAPSLLALPLTAEPAPRGILVTAAQARRMKQGKVPDVVRHNAGAALTAGPWSVTTHRPPDVDASPNDYYSEGPYWWPDPKNPKGPYIRKDGERNPARFLGNRNDLGSMCSAVTALGMGAWLLGDKRCAERASVVLSTWFLDARTRMNPNLEYGQAVRGRNTGRGTGIIDTVSLIHAAQGIALLELEGSLPAPVIDGVHRWFADYLRWMTTSAKGLDEKKAENNHATWWTAQAAAYASLVGDAGAQRMAWDYYRDYLVPAEIQPDGSCPKEEARTQSLSYSAMNLDAFAVLCRIAETNGIALWKYRTARGTGVEAAFRYLLPFVTHPDQWRKPQITRYNPADTIFPGLAGAALQDEGMLATWRSLPRGQSAWTQLVDLAVFAA